MIKLIEPNDQLKQKILNYIQNNCNGRSNAIPKHRIMDMLGIENERLFRQCIHRLRVEEYPILSTCESPAGYFIPIEPGEVDEVMIQFKNRVINQNMACAGIRKGLEKRFPNNQTKIDFDLTA